MNEERIKNLLDIGVSPANILHGYLKGLMYDTQCLQDNAGGNTDYLEGRMDALAQLYKFSYDLSFAEGKD